MQTKNISRKGAKARRKA